MTEFIQPASLSFKEGKTPLSEAFDDIYFSKEDGRAESEYVFLKGAHVADFFAQHKNLCIGETGFGTGLNFLLTWQAWKDSGSTGKLHYISLEAFPLRGSDLQKLFEDDPVLSPLADQLAENYPALIKGFHHLHFEQGQVQLTLLFGLATEVLPQLSGTIDVWYLDGFAPAKNPDMWNETVFKEIARLSDLGTRLTTFTAAGFVKRGLRDVGFTMTKRTGFGHKRDSLIGVMEEKPNERMKSPWYARPNAIEKDRKVAIIGGGIAGCLTAFCLNRAGFDVQLYEQADHLGAKGSGNRFGIIEPRLILDRAGGGRFNHLSYLHALRFYDHLEQMGLPVWKGARGLFNLAQDAQDLAHQKAIIAAEILPKEHVRFIDQDDTEELCGLTLERGGLWFAQSGCLEPQKLCHALTDRLPVHLNHPIQSLHQTPEGWQLFGTYNRFLTECDQVVICCAGHHDLLDPFYETDLRARRGQVSYIASTPQTRNLQVALTCGGYFLPDFDQNEHIVGATFDYGHHFDDPAHEVLSDQSHQDNLSKMERFIPNWQGEAVGGRASMRAMVADKRPVVGPVFNQDQFISDYQDLKHGPRKKNFPKATYVKGLWVMNALGSRGVQSAPLLCDILTCYMTGKPFVTEIDVVQALHPARFLIRKIIKGKR